MVVTESGVMKNIEMIAVDHGIGMDRLMENAGAKVADLAAKLISERKLRSVCVLCGSGNNGGDGFVIARLLAVMCSVKVILTCGEPKTELARMNMSLLPGNVEVLYYSEHYYECIGIVRDSDMIIDAVYGIGFRGELPADISDLFGFCNDNKRAVRIAADLPSGIECDTGRIGGLCFCAHYTVTFTALKPLHVLYPSADKCGIISVESVGIPESVVKNSPYIMLSTDEFVAAHPFPQKKASAHKGDNGTLLSVCGSYGMAGAAMMSAEAALRMGVGLLKLAVPESIYPIIASRLAEPVYKPLAQSKDGMIDIDEYGKLIDLMNSGCNAALIGCGIGRSTSISSLVALLVDGAVKPLVLDADGINAISSNINVLKRSAAPIVLTPHPGEMAKLLGTDISTVQSDRYHIARRFALDYGVTLVLKGANTLVAAPNGRVYVNLTGNNGMGKGGSGDVLAGMIASLLAQGMDTESAAVSAVYYHGLAGDRCAEKFSARSMLPTDMIAELKTIF
ncbi:MAG: NAD(P)H-hydrate dehydratase [Clostridia bacterium]|nr:NAD(P)H-hydrate dehydratase [Clostridia bacterium]